MNGTRFSTALALGDDRHHWALRRAAGNVTGFEIKLSGGSPDDWSRPIYVHGLQAENHGDGNLEFDPILAESRGVDPLPYEKQPIL
jgi:hypothetical protein